MALRWLRPFVQFIKVESASGVRPFGGAPHRDRPGEFAVGGGFALSGKRTFGVGFREFALHKTLLHWINDGLMTLFFFVVGLEIKREIVAGELSEWQQGGVADHRGGRRHGGAGRRLRRHALGTADPGRLGHADGNRHRLRGRLPGLLGPRVPHRVKVLLLSLAIADDIGATLVIALVYTNELSLIALAVGGVGFVGVISFRWIGVRATPAYAVLGAIIWIAFVNIGGASDRCRRCSWGC